VSGSNFFAAAVIYWSRINLDYSQRHSASGLTALDDCQKRLSIVGCMSWLHEQWARSVHIGGLAQLRLN
jgi:hypothetical protein